MKSVDCNIIKDLLPNYIDKLSSKETNDLVENHLQTCKECSKIKDMYQEKIVNQDKQIDYLKGYRKKKIFSVISAIIITMFVIISVALIGCSILVNTNFYMNVTDVELYYTGMSKLNGNRTLHYEMTSYDTLLDPFCWDYDIIKDTENKAIYMKVVVIFPFGGHKARSFCTVEIDDDTECVYLIDSKGHERKIWDKEQGVLTRTHIYPNIY